jgi:hypothetical protein
VADQGSDVASTLNELERKLRALEADLQSAIGEPQPPLVLSPQPSVPDAPAPVAPVAAVTEPAHAPLSPLTDEDPERIVSEARRRISDLRTELDELALTREQIAETANELVNGYNRALNERPARVPPPVPQPLTPEHTILQGAVAIDAGFFRDITSLSAFEQSIARVPGVVGVHVRAFAEGRAVIDAQLSHPIALGAELARHAPLRFTVTEAGPEHLMLAISS